jgi:hypothetical protein
MGRSDGLNAIASSISFIAKKMTASVVVDVNITPRGSAIKA